MKRPELKKQELLKEIEAIEKLEKGIVDIQMKDSLEKLREAEKGSYEQKLMMLESVQRNVKQALDFLHNL
tara:strand:- start:2179 stop:2388 length:210 start_codon:yes stop_codon:yes gene_type:complete